MNLMPLWIFGAFCFGGGTLIGTAISGELSLWIFGIVYLAIVVTQVVLMVADYRWNLRQRAADEELRDLLDSKFDETARNIINYGARLQ